MQVSPDKSARLNQAGPIGRIPVSPQNAAGLKDGDVLIAVVERILGDMLLLRLYGGSLLQAELQGGARFSEGDVIEASVSKDGARCLLYVLNVLRTGAQAGQGGAASTVSPQTLSAMLAILKRNPGLDADIALFLAQNGIPDTEENIAALAQLSRGTGVGALLGEILDLLIRPGDRQPEGSAPADPVYRNDASPPDSGAGEAARQSGMAPAVTAGQPEPAGAATGQYVLLDAAEAGQREGSQAAAGQQGLPGGTAGAAQTPAQGIPADAGNTIGDPEGSAAAKPGETAVTQAGIIPEQAAPQPGAAPEAPSVPQRNADGHPIGQTEPQPTAQAEAAPASPAPEGMAAGAEGETVPTAAGQPDADIDRGVRELFFLPGKQGGEEAKRTAEGLLRALKALKSELVQSDIRYKELCLKNTDQAIRQMELADRAARFEHIQLPLTAAEGEYRTAELFVFRRQGGRKRDGGSGVSILVALDTEHIGRVETLIREAGGRVSLEFRLEQLEMAEIFSANSAPLREAVEAAGYQLTGMRYAGLEKRTTVVNAGELMALEAGEAVPGIDVQI